MPEMPEGKAIIEVGEREFPYQGSTYPTGSVLLVGEETAAYACDEADPPFARRVPADEAAERGLFVRTGAVSVDDENVDVEAPTEAGQYHFTPAAAGILQAEGIHTTDYEGPATGPKDGRHVTAEDVRTWLSSDVEDAGEIPEVDISEAARELAHEHGVDVTQIDGSGKGGRIIQPDVKEVIDEGD